MAHKEITLMAHLMRRAGFGSTRQELERRVNIGYEATVDELLNPGGHGIKPIDEALMFRAQPCFEIGGGVPTNSQCEWMYRLINTPPSSRGKDGFVLASGLRHRSFQARS